MNDHLPECYQSEGKWGGGCICVRLRACEQRTLDAYRDWETDYVIQPLVEGSSGFLCFHI